MVAMGGKQLDAFAEQLKGLKEVKPLGVSCMRLGRTLTVNMGSQMSTEELKVVAGAAPGVVQGVQGGGRQGP